MSVLKLLYVKGAPVPRGQHLKPQQRKETTNFSRKTTLIRPQISKPHGAGKAGMKILLHVNLAFVILAKNVYQSRTQYNRL